MEIRRCPQNAAPNHVKREVIAWSRQYGTEESLLDSEPPAFLPPWACGGTARAGRPDISRDFAVEPAKHENLRRPVPVAPARILAPMPSSPTNGIDPRGWNWAETDTAPERLFRFARRGTRLKTLYGGGAGWTAVRARRASAAGGSSPLEMTSERKFPPQPLSARASRPMGRRSDAGNLELTETIGGERRGAAILDDCTVTRRCPALTNPAAPLTEPAQLRSARRRRYREIA